jgi:hypothetical protein
VTIRKNREESTTKNPKKDKKIDFSQSEFYLDRFGNGESSLSNRITWHFPIGLGTSTSGYNTSSNTSMFGSRVKI